MNTTLWVLQALLAAAFLGAGLNYIQYDSARARIAFNVVLFLLAASVAYGRLALVPL